MFGVEKGQCEKSCYRRGPQTKKENGIDLVYKRLKSPLVKAAGGTSENHQKPAVRNDKTRLGKRTMH